MPLYEYTAIDVAGKESFGTINADSEKQARTKIRNDGLIPVEIIALSQSHSLVDKKARNIDKRLNAGAISLFTRELCALISAGLEIEQSVKAVSEQTENKHLKKIIEVIHSKILEGYSFSSGLNAFPKAFPKVYRATIKAGEEAGHLGQVLDHLADYLDAQEQMRQKIIQAILYPGILTLISVGIVTFLLTFVTPKIISIFEESKDTLPWVTTLLLKISNYLQHYGILTFIIIIIMGYIAKRLLLIPSFKEKYDQVVLHLPLIGKTSKLIETARFLRTLAILTQAQVPILQAFQVASDLITRIPIRKEILIAKERIKEGSTIFSALKNAHYFSASSLQFIASGENSGNLEEMLVRSAQNQERHVQFTLNTLLAAFEPLLIVVMGAVVLFIVLATLLPIFQLSQMVN